MSWSLTTQISKSNYIMFSHTTYPLFSSIHKFLWQALYVSITNIFYIMINCAQTRNDYLSKHKEAVKKMHDNRQEARARASIIPGV